MTSLPERRDLTENHVQTIISFIVLCTLAWVGTTVMKNTELLSSLKTDIAVIKAKDEMSRANEYDKQDAKADLAYRDAKIDTIEDRLSRLEYENRTVERLRYDDYKNKPKKVK